MESRIQFIDEGENLAASNNKNDTRKTQDNNEDKQLEIRATRVRTKPRRERAAHSKTRTGCRTCKARHIKCDEKQPACLRCTTTGRTCEGYEPPNPTRWLIVTGPSQPSTAYPSIHPILPTAYPDSLIEDEQIRDSFDFFRNVAAHELSHFFGKSFWLESLLSTSHQFPAVTSAVLALSSLHRRLKDGEPTKGDLFAGRQYEKSLKQLIRAISSTTDKSHARIMSLLCGVIYTVIEVLNGSWSQARQHLDSIIQLLNEKTSESKNGGSENVLVSDAVLRDLRAIIVRFDIEAATYSNGRSPQMTLPPLRDSSPTTNLDQTEAELYDLMLHAITFMHTVRPYRFEILDEPVPEQFLLNQQQIRGKMASWWDNHETALKKLAAGTQGKYDARRAASLIVHYHNCWTSLNCSVYPYETDYDAYYSNFAELVQYATLIHSACMHAPEAYCAARTKGPATDPVLDPNIDPALASYVHQSPHSETDENSTNNPVLSLNNLLNPHSETPSPRRSLSPEAQSTSSTASSSHQHQPKRQFSPPPYPKPTAFSPETGLLFPLFWAATRCRDGLLRRQALKQITLCQQEGVWCPGAQARVASRVIELEEGLEPWSVLEACINGDSAAGAWHAVAAATDPYQVTQGTTLLTTPTPPPPLTVLPKASDIPEHKRCHHIMWPVDRVNRTGNMAYGILPRGVEGGWEIRYEWII